MDECPPLSFLKVANRRMIKKKYIYWQDDDMWLGYLEEYPDYWTQGETEEELRENLLDIYSELTSGNIQNIRRVAELEVS
ncbi:MAG: type II toxin-antitoxin system HicB family antitoxin [Nostoc sp. DedQUE02]